MFTGLVEEIGRIARLERRGPSARVVVEMRAKPLVLGESVAVDGVCLTVDRITNAGFEADASSETLARTTLGSKSPGAPVHLERATPLGGRMGGHIVAGHVDGIGRVTELRPLGEARRLTLEIDAALAPYVATKGSIALDGVSLTLNGVADHAHAVLLELVVVPHTLGSTKLGALGAGDTVNVEVDVLARYVARQLAVGGPRVHGPAGASEGTSHERRAEQRTGSGGEDRDDSLLRKLREGGFA